MQAVPALGRQRLVAQLLVTGHAPHVRGHVEGLGQDLLGPQRLEQDDAAAEELCPVLRLGHRRAVEVHALEDSLLDSRRHRGHRVVLVVERQVVEDVLPVHVHAMEAFANDGRDLVGERRVVGADVRNRGGQHVAVAVLVLEALAVEGGAAGGGTEHEAAAAGVAERPGEVAGALEAEHRVEDVERDHGLAVGRVAGARGGERGHRAGLGDALLEELAVLLLAVGEEQLRVHRLVLLAAGGVDADLREQHLHAEGARLVGDDRHDALAPLGVAHQVAEQLGERHRGRDRLLLPGARGELVEHLGGGSRQRLRPHHALGHAPAERAAALEQVAHLVALGPRMIVGRIVELGVRDRQLDPIAEGLELLELCDDLLL